MPSTQPTSHLTDSSPAPHHRVLWKTLSAWLAPASALVYVWSRFVADMLPDRYGLIDAAWIQTMHAAFIQHWQFGRDVVFPFGPWGFLYGGYDPATRGLYVLIWLALAITFWWAGWRVARHLSPNPWLACLWLVGFTAAAGNTMLLNIDVRLTAWAALLCLLHFFVEDAPFTPLQAALVVGLGLLGLIKFSFLVTALVVLVLIALDTVFRQRRFPWLLPLFGGSSLFFWLAARQELGMLGPFLRHSWPLMTGYTEAMMVSTPDETSQILLFLLVAAAIAGLGAYAAWRRCGRFGLLPFSALGWLLFTAFKYGYVRHDAHVVTAALQLLLLALAGLAMVWPLARLPGPGQAPLPASLEGNRNLSLNPSRNPPEELAEFTTKITTRITKVTQPRWPWSRALAISAPVLLAVPFAAFSLHHYAAGSLPAEFARSFLPERLLFPARLLFAPQRLQERYQEYLARTRAHSPLPPLAGTTDVYPWNGSVILAHGLPYRPRPLLHSYAAYTPELAGLDAAFLRSARAPQNILFGPPFAVEDRYPSLDDSLSWPELLACYDIRQVQLSFLVCQRAPAPRPWRLQPLQEKILQLGQAAPLPPLTNSPLWAQIEVTRTLWGRILSVLYKPPALWLTATLRDGTQGRWRLVPEMARAGFLLSPLVTDCLSLAGLAGSSTETGLSGKELVSLSISADPGGGAVAAYQSPVRLRLYRLEFAPQDVAEARGFRELTHLSQAVARARTLNADVVPRVAYLPLTGSVLFAPPNSAIALSPNLHPKQLRLAFGVLAPQGKALGPADKVCFRVSIRNDAGMLVPLWSRELALPDQAPSRVEQAVVDLQTCSSSNFVLETLCTNRQANVRPISYWSDIVFD